MNVYVALIRGIIVGGSYLIRMPALLACFEAQGLRDVSTYIQSGNVLFTTGRSNQQALTSQIEKVLSKTFAYRSRVVVRSFEQMKAIVEAAPIGFGARPTASAATPQWERSPVRARGRGSTWRTGSRRQVANPPGPVRRPRRA